MNIMRLAFLIGLSGLLVISFHIGCDELITEQIKVTEAGHPTADFALVDPEGGFCCPPCPAAFRDLSNGPRHIYIWWFGDGDSLFEYFPDDPTDYEAPVHTYETAGIYTVALKIIDTSLPGEDIFVHERFITVGTPSPDFVAEPASGCAGLEVSFLLNEYSLVTSYDWDYGDGTEHFTGINPTHVYEDTGIYTVTLIADDGCGSDTGFAEVVIGQCPDVAFDAAVTEGCWPLEVSFENYTELWGKSFVSRVWTFGDGDSDTAREPIHEYISAGSYTVSLTVTTEGGTATDSVVGFITVADAAAAGFDIEGDSSFCWSANQQFRVNFLNQSVGAFDSLRWYFGDGFTDTATNPVHVYLDPGVYSCTLEAYGPGLCGADTLVIDSFIWLSDAIFAAIDIDTISGTGGPGSTFRLNDISPTSVISNRQWYINSALVAEDAIRFDTLLENADTYVIQLITANDCGTAHESISLEVIIQ